MDENTRDALDEGAKSPCVWLERGYNGGKGQALRDGVAAVSGDLYVFTDVDFPYTERSMLAVVDQLTTGRAQIVAGIRQTVAREGSTQLRQALSSGLRWFNRHVLSLPIDDTQCGLKGFDRAGRELFLAGLINGYLFDLEFLWRAHRAGTPRLCPIEVEMRAGVECERVRARVLWQESRSLWRIAMMALRR